jgi:hypothetical protein
LTDDYLALQPGALASLHTLVVISLGNIITKDQGRTMASIELSGTVKALKVERAKVQSEFAKLDKAISVLEGLSGPSTVTSNGNEHKRIMSAAARNKIAKAQKLRWAKIKKERAAKA